MPRNGRIQMVGKAREAREVRERADDLRELERELRRQWRARWADRRVEDRDDIQEGAQPESDRAA